MFDSKEITLTTGAPLTVRELTARQLDQVVRQAGEERDLDKLYQVIDGDITAAFVEAATGLDLEAQGALSMADLDVIVPAVKDVNRAFLSRLADRAGRVASGG